MADHGANGGGNGNTSPFLEIARSDWAGLAPNMEQPLSPTEIVELRGLGDRLDIDEVSEVYLPLSKLISLYAVAARRLAGDTATFLGRPANGTTFVIGVAGSVAVGKSTIARLLRELLSRWEDTPRVELITTDGFLLPNTELERRGLMHRKGFPESYDRRALLRFVTQVKSGVDEVRAPFYSHLSYDIVKNAATVLHRPDILIVEGLNVLQPAMGENALAVSDLFDFTVYVDARTSDIANWYVERFLKLQQGAFANPRSYFHRLASMDSDESVAYAKEIWGSINEPNLLENILPTRSRADLVLRKGSDHTVKSVLLRKL